MPDRWLHVVFIAVGIGGDLAGKIRSRTLMEGMGMNFDDVEHVIDMLEKHGLTPHVLRVMIFLIRTSGGI